MHRPLWAQWYNHQKQASTHRPSTHRYCIHLLQEARYFTKLDLWIYHLVRIRRRMNGRLHLRPLLVTLSNRWCCLGWATPPPCSKHLPMMGSGTSLYTVMIFPFFSETEEEHMLCFWDVCLRTVSSSRQRTVRFHTTTASFLGFIIWQGQLSSDPSNVQAVAECPTPTNWKQLQQFLGFANI